MATEKKDSWETQEVIQHLINDSGTYNDLIDKDADSIREYVGPYGENHPPLQESFLHEGGNWNLVDWDEVAKSCQETFTLTFDFCITGQVTTKVESDKREFAEKYIREAIKGLEHELYMDAFVDEASFDEVTLKLQEED
jgi:hypothetical protein